MKHRTREIYVVLGMPGHGKSTLSHHLMNLHDRVIVLDPKGEYAGDVVHTFDSFRELLVPYLENWESEKFKIVCRYFRQDDVTKLFEVCNVLTQFLLVVEETEMYLNPQKMDANFMDMIRGGRHGEISLLCVARRSMELNVDLRAAATCLFSFRQQEPHDLRIAEAYGFNAEILQKLQKYQYAWKGENPLNAKKD